MKCELLLVVVALCVPVLLARKGSSSQRDNKRLDKQASRRCEYVWGECRLEAGKTCGQGKMSGTSESPDCTSTEKSCRVKCTAAQAPSAAASNKPAKSTKPSAGKQKPAAAPAAATCQYKVARETAGSRAVCDPVSKKKAVTQTLVRGGAECAPRRTSYKPCKPRQERDTMAIHSREREDSRCKYKRGQKGECSAATNKRTITLTLKRKSPPSCPATKTIEKPCKVKQAKRNKAGDSRKAGKPNRRRQQENPM